MSHPDRTATIRGIIYVNEDRDATSVRNLVFACAKRLLDPYCEDSRRSADVISVFLEPKRP